MFNLNLLTKYSCLSDKMRWNAQDFIFPFDLTEPDKEIVSYLKRVGDGELTGIGAGILVYDLIKKVPEQYRSAFITSAMYINIIVIEEFRHGVTLSVLNDPDFIDKFDMNTFGNDNLVNLNNDLKWDVYGILLSLCLSEVVNTELYKCAFEEAETPELKELLKNIMKDEARHLSAWRDIIKEISNDDPYHYNMFIKSFDNAIHSHNASIGSSYIDGVRDTLGIFKFDSIDNIVDKKYEILVHCFGNKLPFTKPDLKRGHLNFLANSLYKH
jgi:hypothetical protein